MQLDAYYIRTSVELYKYLSLLENSAKKYGEMNICCVGLDLEYVSAQSNAVKKIELDWIENKDVNCIPCILQLSTDTCCLVINLKELGHPLPARLIHILKSDSWLKMGVGVSLDLMYLSQSYNLGYCGGTFEIRTLAILSQFTEPNLCHLYSYFFGPAYNTRSPTKPHNWLTPLTEDEFKYAAYDAYMSYRIGMKLLESLVQTFISGNSEVRIHNLNTPPPTEDYFSRLQELAQTYNYQYPIYTYQPLSHQVYQVQCVWPDITDKICESQARTKKQARQDCAQKMYNLIYKAPAPTTSLSSPTDTPNLHNQ